MSDPRRLWTAQEVADYLGVPLKTVYQWNSRGGGPSKVTVGKHVRYLPEDVQVFVEGNRSSKDKPKSPTRSELLAEVALLKALLYDCGGDVDGYLGTPDGVVSA